MMSNDDRIVPLDDSFTFIFIIMVVAPNRSSHAMFDMHLMTQEVSNSDTIHDNMAVNSPSERTS